MRECLHCCEEGKEDPRGKAAEPCLWCGGHHISQHRKKQEADFERLAKPEISPEAEPEFWITREKRKVGHMHDEVG